MKTKELYTTLQKIHEPKGYFFNCDDTITFGVLDGLLANKERYGFMACPCRLAEGEYEADRDIICPCQYREEDVQEFGACYCNLYVSKAFNEKGGGMAVIPERRPPEKYDF